MSPDHIGHLQTPMTVMNAVIAAAYVLLAIFWARRIQFPPRPHRSLPAMLAVIGATAFFVGCAYTHLHLAVNAHQLRDHWFDWLSIVAHLGQAVGGLAFWILGTYFLEVKVFDRRHYRSTTNGNGAR